MATQRKRGARKKALPLEAASDAAGEALVKQNRISREDLAQAHEHEKETGTPWYRQLIQTNKVSFGAVEDILNYQFHSKSTREADKSLGDTLVELGALTEKQLKEALQEQKKSGRLLGDILVQSGYVTVAQRAEALSIQQDIEFSLLEKSPSDAAALAAVPESVATKHKMIPIRIEGDKVTVLIKDPQAQDGIKRAAVLLGLRLYPMLTDCEDVKAEITARYRGQSTEASATKPQSTPAKEKAAAPPKKKAAQKAAKKAAKKQKVEEEEYEYVYEDDEENTEVTEEYEYEEYEESPVAGRFDAIAKQAAGAPVIKLVTTIIEGAVNSGATDIHLDPQDPEMRVRYRIDGVLHDVMSIGNDIEAAVISRLKIMSDIDITETRHPQDGHIAMEINGQEYDVRVATLPTYLGERVVLRLLDQSSVLSGIRDIGLEKDDEKKLLEAISAPYGMVLVTGPTGSGKTTTLYASLNQKNVMTDSIVTLEDPVEYQMSGINQVQIDSDIDLTFANVLRASLRQDIDVLLVGEIRDAETARIAIRAAMTGHLVFSTLHTNDAPEAISTLRNMDVPSFLIASALTAVVGQRLVRKICSDCKETYTPTKQLLQSLRLPATTKKLYRGAGCENCYSTGNRGRTGIFEILEIKPEVRKLIVEDESIDKIQKAAKMTTMADRCRDKVKRGDVTAEEFLRVIRT